MRAPLGLAVLLLSCGGAAQRMCTTASNPCFPTARCTVEFPMGTMCACPAGYQCGEGCGQPWVGHTCVPYVPRCGVDYACGQALLDINNGTQCTAVGVNGSVHCSEDDCCAPQTPAPPTAVPPTSVPPTPAPPTPAPATPAPATPSPATLAPETQEPMLPLPPSPAPGADKGTPSPPPAASPAPSTSTLPVTEARTAAPVDPPHVGDGPAEEGTHPGAAMAAAYGLSTADIEQRDRLVALGAGATVALSASGVDAGVLAVIASLSCGDQVEEPSFVLHPTGVYVDGDAFVGCVITNLSLAMFFPMLHRILASIKRPPCGMPSMGAFLGRIRFPAVPIIGVVFFMQGVVFSGAVLVWEGRQSLDVALGAVALLLCAALIASLVYTLRTNVSRARCVANPLGSTRLRRCLFGTVGWVPTGGDAHYLPKYGLLFSRMLPAHPCWNGVKASALSVMTLASGFRGRDMTECGHVRLAMGSVVLVYLLATLHCQPFRTPKDYWAEVVVTLVQLGSLVLLAGGYYSGQPGHWLFREGVKLTGIAAMLILVKGVLDALINLYGWWYRRKHSIDIETDGAQESMNELIYVPPSPTAAAAAAAARRVSYDSAAPLHERLTAQRREEKKPRRVSDFTAVTHDDTASFDDTYSILDGLGSPPEVPEERRRGRRRLSAGQALDLSANSGFSEGGASFVSPRRRRQTHPQAQAQRVAGADESTEVLIVEARDTRLRHVSPTARAGRSRARTPVQLAGHAADASSHLTAWHMPSPAASRGRSGGRRRTVVGSGPLASHDSDNPLEDLQEILGHGARRGRADDAPGPALKTHAIQGVRATKTPRDDSVPRKRHGSGAAELSLDPLPRPNIEV